MNLFQSQQQSKVTSQRHLYSGKLLATLAIASVVSVLLISGDYVFQNSLSGVSSVLTILGMMIYLLVIATITVVDWRSFFTMNGWLKWQFMTSRQRLIVGCLFAALNVFALGVYLAQAYLTYRRYKLSEPQRRRRKIAELEAELGIIPQTDGNCYKCHQPLQLGAEFCAYCGERAMQRPRICPECSATALPDARWCPECGTNLGKYDDYQ